MPMIDLQQVTENLVWSVAEETLTPSAIYDAWAVALGLSPSATLYSLNSDDLAWPIDLGVTFWPGLTQLKAMWSSEAGIGLYSSTPTNTTKATFTIPGISRFFGLGSRPTLLITWHPTGSDLESYSCRINRTAAATILFSQYDNYTGNETQRYDVAVKITAGRIEIVGHCHDTATNVIATELTEPSTTTTVRQQVTLLAQAIGTIRRFVIEAKAPATYRLSGVAKFTDGAIATKLRISNHDTGAWISDITPDPATGAYQFDQLVDNACDLTIYRTGYRPLTHGPVSPVELP